MDPPRTASGRARRLLAVVVVLLCLAATAGPVLGAEALYPEIRPPTHIVRSLDLRSAAQAGVVQLRGKGFGNAGDWVSMEVTGKPVRGPVVVRLHVEFHLTRPGVAIDEASLDAARQAVQNRMNRPRYRTRSGDPLTFELDWRAREAGEGAAPGYHQVEIIDRGRSSTSSVGVPNSTLPDDLVDGRFELLPKDRPTQTKVWAHEMLHFSGLDDSYVDVYAVGGKRYPLPRTGMDDDDPAGFRKYLKEHKPPLPPPPAGRVTSQDKPGVGPCDAMGGGAYRDCARLAKKDLEWLAGRAGVEVTAEPGDLLLNESGDNQNFGVGFRSIVFAPPGGTTTADGVSIYCIDANEHAPAAGDVFDVLGPASERPEPGMAQLAALLALNGRLQEDVAAPVSSMQPAVWAVSDGTPLDFGFDPDAVAALLTQAGLAPEPVAGFPRLADPGAGVAGTGGVTTTEALPALPVSAVPARPNRLVLGLYPARAARRTGMRLDVHVVVTGPGGRLAVALQRRAGRRWRTVPRVGRVVTGATGGQVVQLRLPPLARGRYRVRAALNGTSATGALRVR